MTVWTRIATIDRTREARSVNIQSAIGQRSTASFTIYDEDGSLSFSKGQQVDIVKDGFPPFVKVLFSGVVSKSTERRVPANDMVYHHLQCMDWHYLADKRLAAMSWVATEYESYTAGEDGAGPVYGIIWMAQTFTPTTTHNVTRIRLKIFRSGNPGTLTVSVQGVDVGGDPDGTDLCVGTVNANAFTTDTAGEWEDIDMTTQTELTAATQYAIVVRAVDGNATNYLGWRKNSAGGYAGGTYDQSGDSGTTWTQFAQDFMFEEWYYPFAGFIVEDLFNEYLSPEGVTNGNIDQGPAIKEMLVNYQPVSKALDALSVRAGFEWEIDYFKRLYFQTRTTTTAPFAITENLLKYSTSLAHDSSEYRNRQFIRAGIDITALQTETYTGDGATKSFAMGYRINQEPTVTVAGAPQTIGLKGIDTTLQCYWSPGDPILVFAAAPAGAAAIVVTYYGEYDIMVQVEDAAGIAARAAAEGNTGINEAISDEPYLTDKDDAVNSGLASLDYYGTIGKQFNFAITTWGLEPGQIVTVTDAAYGLAAEDLLIIAVRISEIAPNTLRFAVTAITGPNMGDWTAFFGRLAAFKDDLAGRLAVGEDSILIIMDYETATWEIVEAVTTTPLACFLCSATTICEPATIVC